MTPTNIGYDAYVYAIGQAVVRCLSQGVAVEISEYPRHYLVRATDTQTGRVWPIEPGKDLADMLTTALDRVQNHRRRGLEGNVLVSDLAKRCEEVADV